MPASSARAARRNGAHAASTASRCARRWAGWSNTASRGKSSSTGSAPTCRKRLRGKRKEPAMAAKNKSHVITLTRVYDAPLQAVWDAWTIPEEVEQWWGPRGFTLTTHSRDLRTGGHWHYTMHGPDGTDYENTAQYLEVVPRERLVYDHGGHQDRPPLFRVVALFSERQGRTQLDLTFSLATP